MSDRRLSPGLGALVTTIAAMGAVLLAVAAFQWHDEDLKLLAILAGLAVVSEVLDFAPFGNSRISLSVALILVAGTISGLPGVAVVVSVVVVTDSVIHPKPFYKTVFNEGALLLAGAAYVGVFGAFSIGYRGANWPEVITPVLMGTALNFGVNSALVALAIAIETGRNPFSVWNDKLRWLFPYYVIVGILAVMTATSYEHWGVAGIALLLLPLATVWFLLRQYSAMVSSLAHSVQRAD